MLKFWMTIAKVLTITAIINTNSFASAKTEQALLKFQKQKVSRALKRVDGKLTDIKLLLKKDLKQDGWYGYTYNLKFNIQGKDLSQKDTLFSNGKMISMDLIDLKTKRSFRNVMYPTLSKKFFNKKHLIAGDPNAKHSVVLFSDPLCPICIDEIPFLIKKIIDNPKNVALYYYHLPLKMHPTARTLSKASILATKQGIKNVDYRIYEANFPEKYKFDAYSENNHEKILNFFNKEFGTNFTMAQINDPKLDEMIEYDIKMSDEAFVTGTPTVFFDGEYDLTRSKFEKYLK